MVREQHKVAEVEKSPLGGEGGSGGYSVSTSIGAARGGSDCVGAVGTAGASSGALGYGKGGSKAVITGQAIGAAANACAAPSAAACSAFI